MRNECDREFAWGDDEVISQEISERSRRLSYVSKYEKEGIVYDEDSS